MRLKLASPAATADSPITPQGSGNGPTAPPIRSRPSALPTPSLQRFCRYCEFSGPETPTQRSDNTVVGRRHCILWRLAVASCIKRPIQEQVVEQLLAPPGVKLPAYSARFGLDRSLDLSGYHCTYTENNPVSRTLRRSYPDRSFYPRC